jgi:hypothetical protein
MVVTVRIHKLVPALLCIFTVLFALNLLGIVPVHNGTRDIPPLLTSFSRESNLPTLFSSAILALCGLLAAVVAAAGKDEGKARYLQWMGVAGVFVFLAIDESALLHERATHAVRHFVELERMGLSHAAWTIPYMAAALLILAVYWRFFWRLPRATRRQFGSGIALYLIGAVGMEFISCIWLDTTERNAVYYLLGTVEESLEMIGIIVIIAALVSYLEKQYPDFSLRLFSTQEAG